MRVTTMAFRGSSNSIWLRARLHKRIWIIWRDPPTEAGFIAGKGILLRYRRYSRCSISRSLEPMGGLRKTVTDTDPTGVGGDLRGDYRDMDCTMGIGMDWE